MSRTDELGKLAVTAGAGIAYRVVDAFGNDFGQGSGTSDFELPEGLYAVQWLSGGEQSETLMRVQKGRQSEARNIPAEDAGSEKSSRKIVRASRVAGKLRPSEIRYGSAIAIVITSTDSRDSREALKSVRLFDHRDVAMRSSENGVPEIVLRSGELARCYQVPPGRFRLAYMSHTGETIEQSIPALRGRQTIIFLEAVRGRVLVAKGSGFVKVQRSGIDAARTVLVSVKGNENDIRIRERFRLTELLLRDLAGTGAALTDDFCSILEQRSVDPLLRLAAATVVMARINAGKSPTLDRPLSEELSASGMRNEWLRRASSWLPRSRLWSWPSDATIAWWEMERLGLDAVAPRALPRSITVPPMFACAWRWAMARSTIYPEAIARNAAMRAAEGGSSVELWLCWKAAAAKGQSPLAASNVNRDSNAFAALLANLVRDTLGEESDSSFRVDPFSVLGPENGALALALHRGSKKTSQKQRPETLAESVASALAISGRSLFQRLMSLEKALEAVDVLQDVTTLPSEPGIYDFSQIAHKGIAQRSSAKREEIDYIRPKPVPGERRARPSKAPAINRRILVPDDPQKGRFGGLSESAGYNLTASFSATSSKNWTRILLSVAGPAADDEPAQFFLHDSFSPDIEEVRFRNGAASLAVTAWGGFTAGLWLPFRGVELELDLAVIPDAPKFIRTR